MTTIDVIQFRFNQGKIRKVELPEIKYEIREVLNDVYHFGQNSFQPKNSPSVSKGDVILIDSDKYIVLDIGFEKITNEFYDLLRTTSDQSDDTTFRYSYRNVLFDKIGNKSFKYC